MNYKKWKKEMKNTYKDPNNSYEYAYGFNDGIIYTEFINSMISKAKMIKNNKKETIK